MSDTEIPPPTLKELHANIEATEVERDAFIVLAIESALAACIVIAHALIVLVIIGASQIIEWAFRHSQHEGHSVTIYGVSAQYLIEGGEIILVCIVLTCGIMSAALMLMQGLLRRFRGNP